MPYLDFPQLDSDGNLIWNVKTHIICFWIIEMHQSDRVKLQSGYL